MNRMLVAVVGAGVGAGSMYLLDPARGGDRRARLDAKAVHASHAAKRVARTTVRDVEHRLNGLAARVHGRLTEEPAPADDVLGERVRARLGRLVSHPGAIHVAASGGTVTLTGPVFEAEVAQLLEGVGAVAGVAAVENKLEPHREATHVSALQGPGPRRLLDLRGRVRWTPTARLVAGVAGLVLVALSSPNRPVRGAATGIAGLELLEHALLGTRRG